ncbi:hypothetical protein DBB29_02960 [Pandoraea cepalis]|uniref:Phage capsid protein n=1 Tax=Pandoraea cepalis TaxID=2508294 RepID=A0AAW7MIT0_9BURK|nr:GPO family capsid scaffolding protein [Pandoraea cepalis]MDN4572665.1 hypothetical protein [Pandoraea cepalis]MDN4577080.1 hypothetical protein [Pandoraea cepalis]
MAKKSKFFVVATEGATTDGRTITKQMIQEMATTYDPKKFGARINLEHYRGVDPQGLFKAYGDVVALKSETNAEGKLQLLAQLDPTDDLVAMTTKDRQKVFTSIEVNPNFAQSGQAYLVGLAVTDNPASLGTEMLQFSAAQKNSPLAGRKQDPENLFTAAEPFTLELEADVGAGASEVTMTMTGSVLERFTAVLFGQKTPPAAPAVQTPQPAEQPPQFTGEMIATAGAEAFANAMQKFSSTMAEAMKPVVDGLEKLRVDHDALVTKLSATDASAPRAPATGAKTEHVTDC